MFDKLPLDAALTYTIIGLLGGAARLALGVKEEGVGLGAEVFRLIVIAAPMACIAGIYAEDSGIGYASYAISYFVGLASLNIARTMMTQGISGIIEAFVRVKK